MTIIFYGLVEGILMYEYQKVCKFADFQLSPQYAPLRSKDSVRMRAFHNPRIDDLVCFFHVRHLCAAFTAANQCSTHNAK